MKLVTLQPIKSIKKAFQNINIVRKDFELFKSNLQRLFDNINSDESEEHNKNDIIKFLEDTYYKDSHYINTKDRTDLVIHKENHSQSPVVVMIETKKPTNQSEMVTHASVNQKAFHELILYYLRERIDKKNYEIKNLIITNSYDWFIFNASEFERLFYNNTAFKKQFENWKNEAFVDKTTATFYSFCENQISNSTDEIKCVHFNLREYIDIINSTDKKNETKLIILYKIFSPEHLLNKPFANDSNSLNINFYNELLYILGLEEIKENGKKIIQRKSGTTRHSGMIIENTIRKLESEQRLDNIDNPEHYGSSPSEQFFNIALELNLTWLNRILFMKLLESQLIRYNKGNKEYKFLDPEKVNQYDQINTLFFKVLNTREEERYDDIKRQYNFIPYLNSSLFDLSELEKKLFTISGLEDDIKIPLYSRTVLKKNTGARRQGEMLTQEYLLRFLDAFDFGSTSAEDIVDEKKDLINASVLGLVFEKINGYKDGSFFTPGFITMYMGAESVRQATLQKFNEKYDWKLKNINDLYNKIDKLPIKEANQIIDDIKICDPAVGSGHFLVSALNEIIALKSELGVLIDNSGTRIRDYIITVENDELHIEYEDGKLFEYSIIDGDSEKGRKINSEKQRVQETLFEEKRKIIENSLFGVDINPNSVQICRLRLWIELLKNSYYTKDSDYKYMETLPNIDINIKCGNSLISKFGLHDNLPRKDIQTLNGYKLAVQAYKKASDKKVKSELKKTIEKIKNKLKGFLKKEDKRANKLAEELHKLNTETDMFASKKDIARKEKRKQQLIKEIEKIKKEETQNKEIIEELLKNTFEWRFEFPEILDDEGNFHGFDIVIGNPPYIQLQKAVNENIKFADLYKNQGFKTFARTGDIYCLFYEKAFQILKQNAVLAFITSNKWMRAGYGERLRNFLASATNPVKLIDFGGYKVFEAATVDTNILIAKNKKLKSKFYACTIIDDFSIDGDISKYFEANKQIMTNVDENAWIISSEIEKRIKEKIEAKGTPLKDWDVSIYRGVLTGYNEAFIIDGKKKDELIAEDPKSAEIIKPILRGRDIKRYYADFKDLWLINSHNGYKYKIDNTKNSPLQRGVPIYRDGVFKKYKQLPYNPKLKQKAKELRKAGNLSEVLLWQKLKKKQFLGLDFHRQKIIGNYIVDFYCPNIDLVIEIDGYSHNFKGEYDLKREEYLKNLNLNIIHFEDKRIKQDLNNVLFELESYCLELIEGNTPPSLRSGTPLREGNVVEVPPVDINDYPAIKKHLDKYWDKLKKRQDKGKTPYNLRNCAYLEEFEKEKLVYPNMRSEFVAFLDEYHFYTNQKCFIITGNSLSFLTCILNSKLNNFYFRRIGAKLGSKGLEMSKIFVEKIPIPQISKTEHKPFIELADKILEAKQEDPQADTSRWEREIDALVYELYGLTEEEIKIVEEE